MASSRDGDPGLPATLCFECQKCVHRYWGETFRPCPRCGSVITTVVVGRLDRAPDLPRSRAAPARGFRVPVRRGVHMARAAVRQSPSTDPDIEIEAEPTPSTKKSKVVKMPKAKADIVVEEKPAKGKTAKAAKPPKASTPSKYIGITSGLRVQEFQNQLMARNFKARLTDAQLAEAMRAEFPHAVAFTEAHVKGIRSGWNHGKRGNPVPEKLLPEYDEGRNPVVRGKGGAPVAKKVKTAKQ